VVTHQQRVKTEDGDLTTYPDVVVYDGGATFDGLDEYALRTPIVLIEVLSPSTADYDRRTKLESYQRIPSLTDYLTVWQDMARVEHHSRDENEPDWKFQGYLTRDEAIPLQSLGIVLPVSEIYRRLDLPEGAIALHEGN
jgi:Uma2 family endonuclease